MNASNIVDYISQRDVLVVKGKGRTFKEAIRQCDEFINDPQVCGRMLLLLNRFTKFIFSSFSEISQQCYSELSQWPSQSKDRT